ncbi:uncharacterized protein LOC123533542 [Mercenaria mercenaria]|uniref:uncharacterized protein LOC123533542 n=1 Tax=Mercenaria mercenaria TaxID=6596 RepID=UPI00234F9D21|nr:uncharacterized protein LOC123533542 [Mercenaria mercenaria]
MANDFLLKKWRALYHGCDINGDNQITMEDAEVFTDRFSSHHKFDAGRTAALKDEYRALWEKIFLKGLDRVTEKLFMEQITEQYNADPVKFKADTHEFTSAITNIFDVNKDGQLSEEELAVCMKSWGLDKFDEKFVKAFPQRKPGFIHNDDYTANWDAYFCNDDESDISKEKPSMYGFGLIDL